MKKIIWFKYFKICWYNFPQNDIITQFPNYLQIDIYYLSIQIGEYRGGYFWR